MLIVTPRYFPGWSLWSGVCGREAGWHSVRALQDFPGSGGRQRRVMHLSFSGFTEKLCFMDTVCLTSKPRLPGNEFITVSKCSLYTFLQ